MGVSFISAMTMGVGLALFFKGRSSRSFVKCSAGVTIALFGMALLGLNMVAEAKKMGVI